MAVNHFFQGGNGIGNKNEKSLYEDLIIEGLKIYGHDVYYLPRTLVNQDLILGEDSLSKFDDSYFTEGMVEKFLGCNNSFKCKGQKAGGELYKAFVKSSKAAQQKFPGRMIKGMAMYEVFYSSKLWYARKSLERYKENNYKKGLFNRRKKDEKEIRSLLGMIKGRNSMREALGMNSDTPAKEAIKKFWLLGEFLDLGTGIKNEKLDKDLKKRKELLEAYKLQIANLKKKLQDNNDEEENEKSVE